MEVNTFQKVYVIYLNKNAEFKRIDHINQTANVVF